MIIVLASVLLGSLLLLVIVHTCMLVPCIVLLQLSSMYELSYCDWIFGTLPRKGKACR
jgi:hypothetical protein